MCIVQTNENVLLQQITLRGYDIDEWRPLNSGLILYFAGSVLVYGHEQRPPYVEPRLSIQ
jgi:hypothetical protein